MTFSQKFISHISFLKSAAQAIAPAPAQTAVQEHVGGNAGEAGIRTNGGTEIITVLLSLPIGLATGFYGAEQILILLILRRHTSGSLSVIQGVDPISKTEIGPGVECVPIRVMHRNTIENVQRVIEAAGENELSGGTKLRIRIITRPEGGAG